MILLDTNAIIYYLQNDKKAVSVIDLIREQKQQIAISTLTEMEILSFSDITDAELFKIGIWLNELSIIPVDSTIAREAAKLRRKYRIKSPDAVIAASAILFNANLVTRDKGLARVKELKVVGC